MLDIRRVLFIPTEVAEREASERRVVKKIVDKRFTRQDKERVLKQKGLEGEELEHELSKFVPEAILPAGEINLAAGENCSFVIESESVALSYTDGTGSEDPHWHPDEVELYFTAESFKVALRSVDRKGMHEIVELPPGRLIVPARVCHLVDLRGHTEVISFRRQSMMQRVNCGKCHLKENGTCAGLGKLRSCFEGEEVLVALAGERSDWLLARKEE